MLKLTRCGNALFALAVLSATAIVCRAGDSPNRSAATIPGSLPPPSALRDHVVNGKLRLTLEDAILLTLLNNPEVRLARTPVDQAHYRIMAAYAPFDPLLTANTLNQRSLSQATNELQGVGGGATAQTTQTLDQLTQLGAVNYTQTFETGTVFSTSFSGGKGDTNSGFYFINPFFNAGWNLQVSQPLLKNRGFFPNMAPIRIARRSASASQDNFEAQVNTSIQQAINQYWSVVLARESLRVADASLKQAQATYDHDKRSLDLGALPPLDIYRSQSEVAQRRVASIQAEYQLKQQEDALRQVVGADLDSYVEALDLDLVEDPAPVEPLFSIDVSTAQGLAEQHRPEFAALREQLAADDISIRLARNNLLPDLELQGVYNPQGVGGTQYDNSVTPPLVTPGGFGDALSQLFHFSYPTYSLSLTFNFPLRNRSARAALGEARVAKTGDLYQMRRQEQAVRLDVLNAVHSLEEAKLSISAAKIARDLTEKTVESEQRKYELGTGTIFLVLEAQTELAQTEVSLVQAEVNYQIALAAVDHATGTLLERHRVQLEQSGFKQP
ncbi:MAG TPA: TolC family protein [Terriglobia bacterium]|nr:TolC family protein [Terriglobia bacterium]